ncbi:probable cytochrome P450 313a3 [Drosophila ficusphila]|uniref:probable cytochrome P450 313a3 n=1 Tax=Drosophila ficusphila TaxID=30025 RepID=UPI0007E6F2F4|nr:probable cytochrome P450 313a3 [Drosophila ficusphila]
MLTKDFLLTIGLFLWMYFLWNRRRLYSMALKLPGPLGLPILGIAIECILNHRKLTIRTKYMDKYGSTVLLWLGITPFIATRDPKVAEQVLSAPECINRSSILTRPIAHGLGEGLLTLEGAKWSERRKHINQAFKHNVLLSFFPIFNAESKSLLTLLDSLVGQGEKDILNDIIRWSFRIATQTTVGTDVQHEENFKNDTTLKSYQRGMKIVILNILLPFTQNKIVALLCGLEGQRLKIVTDIDNMIQKIVDKKLNTKTENSAQPEMQSVINKSIELFRNGEMPMQDVKGECSAMVIAAFETTGLTVRHTLLLLAMFPEYQEIAFEELKELFPTAGYFDVDYEDLQKMVFLDRVLNETLRLMPSVPISARETIRDFRLSNGVVIPKGVNFGVDIFNIHRNPDYWGPDPGKFNPDNFLPDNVRDRHPYAFIPFSKGKRNCIGWRYGVLSAKLALAKILRNFKVSTSFRYEDLEFADNVGIELIKAPGLAFERRT